MNLSEYVLPNKEFDFEHFITDVQLAVTALNDVLEDGLPLHPLQEQRDSVANWRQIGLGVMGIADMLIKMEMPYDSQEAIDLCDRIAFEMANASIYQSAMLAQKRGTYPQYDKNYLTNCAFYNHNVTPDTKEAVEQYGLRNSQLLTIAPTGTLSTMLGISGGIEPVFANSYTRKTESLHKEGDVFYKVFTPIADRYMQEHGLTSEEQLPCWFVTSSTINPIKRIEMQAVWQKHIDASISSTVNLPNSATVEEIETLYTEAWKQGLKGMTIFRDGCKRAGVLTTDSTKTEEHEETTSLKRGEVIKCSDDLIGKKRKLISGCGSLHCLAYFDPTTGDLQEVYLAKGSTGGCNNFMIGLSRMISLACRAGVDVFTIKDQLDSTGACPSYRARTVTQHDTSKGSCCPMAVGNALVEMWKEVQAELKHKKPEVQADKPKQTTPKATPTQTNGICPDCGTPLRFEGGCNSCPNCGYSKCS